MNILVSACLLGVSCRYDGNAKQYNEITKLMKHAHLIPVCPEQLGGLPTPRPPAEIKDGRAITKSRTADEQHNTKNDFTAFDTDVTVQYERGAQQVLLLAQKFNCKYALLKERSPSCGSGIIHDGSFTGALTAGYGITASLLKANGIRVYGESACDKLIADLKAAAHADQLKLEF